ncbi:uncharacterized protein LOC108732618 isoform X3 [Agrilus planipennis]|nr:uncharacterized protein LOC108732618 isoform X3 [Agrilus planipennis]XP_018319019.1 uncharacterized protein LOC108732618 isoform X3 [Agrilus planipennis]
MYHRLPNTPINLVTDAIRAGEVEKLKSLLKTEKLNLNKRDRKGFAPLHAAVIADNLEVLDLLLDQPNVDINVADKNKRTCMSLALLYNARINVIKRLVENGSDVNNCTRKYLTPLHSAVKYCRADIAELLIKSGANINAVRCGGFTPLYDAVLRNNLEMVRLLLFYGADPNTKYYNKSPFMAAISRSYHDIASELIEYVCDFKDTCYSARDGGLL